MGMKANTKCPICGKEFYVKPYRLRESKVVCCSYKCYGVHRSQTYIGENNPSWTGGRVLLSCSICGKELTRQRCEYEPGKRYYCSRKCQHKGLSTFNVGKNNPHWKQGELKTCQYCGKEFQVKDWEKRKRPHDHCSLECYRHSRPKGEESPYWLGGPKTYRGRSWKKARAQAVARDKGTCQGCGRVIGDSVPVHHVKPFREFQSEIEANQLDNLICLCQSCHMKNEPLVFGRGKV